MMEVIGSSETSVLTRATRRNIPEYAILHGIFALLRSVRHWKLSITSMFTVARNLWVKRFATELDEGGNWMGVARNQPSVQSDTMTKSAGCHRVRTTRLVQFRPLRGTSGIHRCTSWKKTGGGGAVPTNSAMGWQQTRSDAVGRTSFSASRESRPNCPACRRPTSWGAQLQSSPILIGLPQLVVLLNYTLCRQSPLQVTWIPCVTLSSIPRYSWWPLSFMLMLRLPHLPWPASATIIFHYFGIDLWSVRFEVFTAVTMKSGAFLDVTPCGSCKNRRFGGT
jgi:hypothetical protein